MTKQKAIKLLVDYVREFAEQPHNDLVLCIEEGREWNTYELEEFIIEERNKNKRGVVGNKSGKRVIKRK